MRGSSAIVCESHSVLVGKPSWRTAAIGSKCSVERLCLSSFVSLPRNTGLPLLSLICVRKEKRRLCLPSTCAYHVTSRENCYQKSVQICTAYAFIVFVYISGTEVSNCLFTVFCHTKAVFFLHSIPRNRTAQLVVVIRMLALTFSVWEEGVTRTVSFLLLSSAATRSNVSLNDSG